MLALARRIRLHDRHEILQIHARQAGHSRLPADATFAVAAGAGDGLAARAGLVALDCVGKVLRILTGKARPQRRDADAAIAVTVGAERRGGFSYRRIADGRSLGPV